MKVFKLGCSSCSFGGQAFAPGADGAFDVPPDAARELVGSHGFTLGVPVVAERAPVAVERADITPESPPAPAPAESVPEAKPAKKKRG